MAFAVEPKSSTQERPPQPVMESFETPEKFEQSAVQEAAPLVVEAEKRAIADEQATQRLRAQMAQPAAPAPALAMEKSELESKIDHILEEDLQNIYRELPEKIRPQFKQRGEETTVKLKRLIESAKATGKQIAKLLRDWLKLIPETSYYFVEQVIKIKTDRLMELAHTAHLMA